MVQAPAYLYGLSALGVPESAFILGKGPLFIFSSVIILVTGTIFAMWLGEKITDKGIGNGISLLIMVGIIANLVSGIGNLVSGIAFCHCRHDFCLVVLHIVSKNRLQMSEFP